MAGGPGVYVFGQEEAKELAEVIDGKYLFRYGLMEDKNFKKKVFTFEEEFKRKWEQIIAWQQAVEQVR